SDDIHSQPMHNPIGNIVYAMSSQNIESTMCNGKWLMKEREVLVVDEAQVLEDVKRQAAKIKEKAGISIPVVSKFKLIED
ncbi:MAG: hypothetical protein ACRCW2_09400, partial [Cellulosilyticaceae bacterium]